MKKALGLGIMDNATRVKILNLLISADAWPFEACKGDSEWRGHWMLPVSHPDLDGGMFNISTRCAMISPDTGEVKGWFSNEGGDWKIAPRVPLTARVRKSIDVHIFGLLAGWAVLAKKQTKPFYEIKETDIIGKRERRVGGGKVGMTNYRKKENRG